jgi:pyridoxal phosphate enzyme (YggS family)
MEEVHTRIERNLSEIRARIDTAARSAGRDSSDVRLIAVTKTVGAPEIAALVALGVKEFGENRPELAAGKIRHFNGAGISWHMIGSVQRRKARDIVQLFDHVDSVDRVEVAEALNQRCEELDRTLPILIEVNVSGENSKHGFCPEDLIPGFDYIKRLPRLHVEGLMTMAPLVDDPETVRPVFRRLRELATRHGLTALSMGMSHDFEVAVQEGATQIRIGTALFS